MPTGKYLRTERHRLILSQTAKKYGVKPPSRLGIPNTDEQKLKISRKLKGIKHSNEVIQKRANTNKTNHDINGRKTSLIKTLRASKEYKLWRKSVFERDKYRCLWCDNGGRLNADHIKPFSQYPELRFAIDNGRTLCVSCHLKTDTFGAKSIASRKIINQ